MFERSKILAFALSASIAGCASYKLGPADFAQALDGATTAFGIYGADAVETNGLIAPIVGEPIGMAALIVFKQALVAWAKSMEPQNCRPLVGIMTGLGLSAGVNNLLVLAGAGSPGAAVVVPAGLLIWWGYDKLGFAEWECKR